MIRSYIADLKAYEKHMAKFLFESDRIVHLFKHHGSAYNPIGYSRAKLLIGDCYHLEPTEFEQRLSELLNATQKQRQARILKNINAMDSIDEEQLTTEQFMITVNTVSATGEQVSVAIDCYTNYDKYIIEIRDIVLAAGMHALQRAELFDNCIALFNKHCSSKNDVLVALRFFNSVDPDIQRIIGDSSWEQLHVRPAFGVWILDFTVIAAPIFINPIYFMTASLDMSASDIGNVLKLLADPTRLNIMHALCTREMNTKQLADELGLTSSTISHHMSLLCDMGLVLSLSSGLRVRYRSEPKAMARFISGMKRCLMVDSSNGIVKDTPISSER